MEKAIMGFPFRQIGEGLRWMSLQGGGWDAIAWILYVGISIVPIVYLFYKAKHKQSVRGIESMLLVLISLGLFAVIYIMINPGILSEKYQLLGGTEFCVSLWSGIVIYIVLVITRSVKNANAEMLLHHMRIGLIVLGVLLLLFSIMGIFTELLPAIADMRKGNRSPIDDLSWEIGKADPLETSSLAMWVVYLIKQISVIAEIIVIRYAIKLIDAIKRNRYSEETITSAKELGDICLKSAIVIAVIPLVINLLQLWCSDLYVLSYQYTIPIVSILMIIGIYLLAHYFAVDKEIKEENDMFI